MISQYGLQHGFRTGQTSSTTLINFDQRILARPEKVQIFFLDMTKEENQGNH